MKATEMIKTLSKTKSLELNVSSAIITAKTDIYESKLKNNAFIKSEILLFIIFPLNFLHSSVPDALIVRRLVDGF